MGRGDDRGQVLPLMALVVIVVAGSLVVAVALSERLDAAARARTAADASALAGAAAGESEARAVARANGGEVLGYTEVGQVVVVVVRVGSAIHESWAEAVVTWEPVSARG
jgi:Flp pilus assembly protein TadG